MHRHLARVLGAAVPPVRQADIHDILRCKPSFMYMNMSGSRANILACTRPGVVP